MQKPKPTNATGVPIVLTALDPNGNIQNIGTVTSDMGGLFKILWTPPVEGAYTISAKFEGSESYWQSSDETAIGVGPAQAAASASPTSIPTVIPTATPAATTPTTQSPSPSEAVQPPTSAAPTTTYIAIGVAIIVIVAAVAALVLRRRK